MLNPNTEKPRRLKGTVVWGMDNGLLLIPSYGAQESCLENLQFLEHSLQFPALQKAITLAYLCNEN